MLSVTEKSIFLIFFFFKSSSSKDDSHENVTFSSQFDFYITEGEKIV